MLTMPEANVAMARVVMGDSVFGIMAIHTITSD